MLNQEFVLNLEEFHLVLGDSEVELNVFLSVVVILIVLEYRNVAKLGAPQFAVPLLEVILIYYNYYIVFNYNS